MCFIALLDYLGVQQLYHLLKKDLNQSRQMQNQVAPIICLPVFADQIIPPITLKTDFLISEALLHYLLQQAVTMMTLSFSLNLAYS